ncbi:MAG: hypothetical protein WCJ01_09795 [Ignavibacteria bacterium]
MVLSLIVIKTDDGFTAEVPTIKGCECWAHEEAEVIDRALDLVTYYLKLGHSDFVMDMARKSGNKIIYKIVFHKP